MFELLLSAISAGGLVGASNQYMCLLVLSIAAKLGLVGLVPQVGFIESWWFLAVVAVFWILTMVPAYGSALGPGVMNVVSTIVNILSGFLVPISGALLALAAAGQIADMNPTLYDLLRTLQIFDPSGDGIGRVGWMLAGGAGVTATALTGAKFLAKPAVSSATGTAGSASAPIFATIENAAAIALMVAAYVLIRINPWLLVALLALIVLALLTLFGWAIYQLWRLGKGIGRVIQLIETRPKAGLAIVAEFLLWGSGSLAWQYWARGAFRASIWVLWVALIVAGIPAVGTLLAAALAPVPFLEFLAAAFVISAETMTVVGGLIVGARSAASLMKILDQQEPAPAARPSKASALA
jgi:hypothetical protein